MELYHSARHICNYEFILIRASISKPAVSKPLIMRYKAWRNSRSITVVEYMDIIEVNGTILGSPGLNTK